MSDAAPTNDLLFSAFAASVCDVIAAQILEARSIAFGLEKKGIFSFAEWQQAKREIPPESISELAEDLNKKVRERMLQHLKDLGGSQRLQ